MMHVCPDCESVFSTIDELDGYREDFALVSEILSGEEAAFNKMIYQVERLINHCGCLHGKLNAVVCHCPTDLIYGPFFRRCWSCMADVMIIDLSQRQETDEFRELYVSSKKDIERLQSQVKTLEDLGQVQNTVDHDDALKSESEQAEIVNLTEGQVLRNSGGAHADSPDAMSESMELREPKEG